MSTGDGGAALARAQLAALFAPGSGDGTGAADAAALQERAAAQGRDHGWAVLPLGLQAAADVRELARLHAAITLQSLRHGRPMAPTLLLSGGPVLRGTAPAGPADLLLAFALALDEHRAVHATAVGPDPAAGAAAAAFMQPDTLARARAAGRDPGRDLLAGAAAALFDGLGELRTGGEAGGGALVHRAILITMD